MGGLLRRGAVGLSIVTVRALPRGTMACDEWLWQCGMTLNLNGKV